MLIERRNKIGQVYFSRINPLLRFALTDAGVLTFENPAVRAQFATAPERGTRRRVIGSTTRRGNRSRSGRRR